MLLRTPAGRMHEFGDPVKETSMKNHLCRMSGLLANRPAPSNSHTTDPPNRADEVERSQEACTASHGVALDSPAMRRAGYARAEYSTPSDVDVAST